MRERAWWGWCEVKFQVDGRNIIPRMKILYFADILCVASSKAFLCSALDYIILLEFKIFGYLYRNFMLLLFIVWFCKGFCDKAIHIEEFNENYRHFGIKRTRNFWNYEDVLCTVRILLTSLLYKLDMTSQKLLNLIILVELMTSQILLVCF